MRTRVAVLCSASVVCALCLFAGGGLQVVRGDEPGDKPAIVLNVTSGREDVHAVTMALQLAGHGLDDGRPVVVFLNVRAVDFARRDLSEAIAFDGNPPVKKMISALMGRGARVLVCPHCAKALGVGEDDIIDGAQMATRESLFGSLGAGAAVFSY